MTKQELTARRLDLIAELNLIGPAQQNTPGWTRREEIAAELRGVNSAIKDLNIAEARRAKSEADSRKARGMAEHVANLQRAGVQPEAMTPASPPPAPARATETPGEFVLRQARRLRKTLRRFNHPLEHTVEFLPLLDAFIERQADHVRDEAQARPAVTGPSEWQETWRADNGGAS